SNGWSTDGGWLLLVDRLNRRNGLVSPLDIPAALPTIFIDNQAPIIQDPIFSGLNYSVQQQILDIRANLQGKQVIEAYPDGSLSTVRIANSMGNDPSDNLYSQAGAACYFPEIEKSVAVALSLWPSSTRSELVGILLCVMCLPEDVEVTIFTDSQAAI